MCYPLLGNTGYGKIKCERSVSQDSKQRGTAVPVWAVGQMEKERKSSAEHIRKHSLFTGAVDGPQQAHTAPLCSPSSQLPQGAAILLPSLLPEGLSSARRPTHVVLQPWDGTGHNCTQAASFPAPPAEAVRQKMRSSTAYRCCFQTRQAAALHTQAARPSAIQTFMLRSLQRS